MQVIEENFQFISNLHNDKVISLAGNPNVGKSTVFNSLTGLNQHTGNWPGKTVANAFGNYNYKDKNFILVDLPGTYSLMSNSVEEEIARDFICFGNPSTTIVVVDATCLDRNLNLVLQTIELSQKVVVCVNLMDEAKRKGISIDLDKLSDELGVPVVGTSVLKKEGLDELIDIVYDISYDRSFARPMKIIYEGSIEEAISMIQEVLEPIIDQKLNSRWLALRLIDGDESLLDSIEKYLSYDLRDNLKVMEVINKAKVKLGSKQIDLSIFRDKVVSHIVSLGEEISHKVVSFSEKDHLHFDRKIDRYITSKTFGIPLMILLLGAIFWITIFGANYPSELLATGLFWIQDRLTSFFTYIGTPDWVHGVLVLGIYRTLAWVIAVMLPPMAIFFPLFTFLEDLGYLPRVAFNLDRFFKNSSACGKQALTMCMGFGCNAAGVIGCRIIDSPREQLIAIITNNFVPCNGRFPILIAITSMFFVGFFTGPIKSIVLPFILTSTIVLGVIMTLFISKLLSKTILKGLPSTFTLELPPYRKPQLGRIIVRSILDRTLFVLGRAIIVAAPAGLIIWLIANINVGSLSILTHSVNFLDPFARIIGLDGYILMAFILGLPANEIVIPLIIMAYMASGSMFEFDSFNELRLLLVHNGWTWLTALSTMLFTLFHWPCATTLLTIKKETQSLKWTFVSFLIPTITGIAVCFIVASLARIMGLV